jgi:hypothetical protein
MCCMAQRLQTVSTWPPTLLQKLTVPGRKLLEASKSTTPSSSFYTGQYTAPTLCFLHVSQFGWHLPTISDHGVWWIGAAHHRHTQHITMQHTPTLFSTM